MTGTHDVWAAGVRFLLTEFCRLMTGVRVRWVGCAPAPGPRIYFANHTSHLDGLVIWTGLPPEVRRSTYLVAARDYWECSPMRRYLAGDVFRTLLVDRHPAGDAGDAAGSENVSRERRHPLAPLTATLARGDSLVLFPEGTRNSGEKMAPFRSGLYHLARACPEAELVPVYLENFHRVLPKGCLLAVPILCSVTVGAPRRRRPGETRRAFLERMRAAIEELRA